MLPGRGASGGGTRDDPRAVPPADGRGDPLKAAPRPSAEVRRTGRWVSWRTVPALLAGALAAVAVAVLVWCRGAARADSALTDRMVRWWAGVWLRAAGGRVAAQGLEHLMPTGGRARA